MNADMNVSTNSDSKDKLWEHAWSTEEIRKNRRDWSLASDVGLLKHLQRFSDNVTQKAEETQEALDSLTAQLNDAAILVDNVTNTSLALANTQFIESRVQEDDLELEKPPDVKNDPDQELSASELLSSVYESIKQGLSIMDEKYEKLEVVASDSEDEADNNVPSVILRPKDPYQDRPLPYVINSEKWLASNKVGLESSSESEQMEEDEESESDDDKAINILKSSTRIQPIDKSSASSGSNDYNIDSSSKDMNNRLYARSQDTLNSDTEPTTPTMPQMQNSGQPSFAEELAKRLGSVYPIQRNVIIQDTESNESPVQSKDLFESDDEDIFVAAAKSAKAAAGEEDRLKSENSTSWKNVSKPVSKNIIPPSFDIPPPMSSVSTKAKSAIDDLFGDGDSDDSDIFVTQARSKSIFPDETIKSGPGKNTNIDSVINIMTASIPDTKEQGSKGLFDDDEDDLFRTSKTDDESSKKIPKYGVSIFGDVDIRSSSRFMSRVSSDDSDSESSNSKQISGTANSGNAMESNASNVSSANRNSLVAGNIQLGGNNSESPGSSGISNPQPIDEGSSLGGEFKPQMPSSRLKSEEIYQEKYNSDSLFSASTRKSASNTPPNTGQRSEQRSQETSDDIFDAEDVFGPPPLPVHDVKQPKSKVASLFDDSDSGDDLFSTSNLLKDNDSFKSSPSQLPNIPSLSNKKSLFSDEGDLLDTKDSPDVDLFGAATNIPIVKENPILKEKQVSEKSVNKVPTEVPIEHRESSDDELFVPKKILVKNEKLIGEPVKHTEKVYKKKATKAASRSSKEASNNLFGSEDSSDDDLFGTTTRRLISRKEKAPTKKSDNFNDLFNPPDLPSDNLFGESVAKPKENSSKNSPVVFKEKKRAFSVKPISIFDDSSDEEDLFGSTLLKKESKIKDIPQDTKLPDLSSKEIKSGQGLFSNMADNKVEEAPTKNTKTLLTSAGSLFDDDDDDLFGDKKISVEKNESEEKPTEVVSENGSSESEKSPEENESKQKPEVTKPQIPPKKISAELAEKVESRLKLALNRETGENVTDGGCFSKKEPPKTLLIPQPGSEETNQAPRKAVSRKIENLIGKVGNVKLLSPADTPPLLRRQSEEKNSDKSQDALIDRDSDEGSSLSIPSTAESSPQISEVTSRTKESSPSLLSAGHSEIPLSFDEPAQVETLASTASKSRARIPTTRRKPQSRQARQSALRYSGIDFDNVDSIDPSGQNRTEIEVNRSVERLLAPASRIDVSDNSNRQHSESSHYLLTDDKSDQSLSKDYTLSANRNTLLSPSTDEEDLFDVPPDLPEDSLKEDSLFGKAPMLSPAEKDAGSKIDDILPAESKASTPEDLNDNSESSVEDIFEEAARKKEPADPLRDKNHDPLKDPSQLFAFVTKTPSPEKNNAPLFNDDDSLFSNTEEKSETTEKPTKKPELDLFSDVGDDLFSAPKSIKKPVKDSSVSLFGDEPDDDLFSSIVKEDSKKEKNTGKDLKSPTKTKSINDSIFDDSSDDGDIFTNKKLAPKNPPVSIFDDEDDGEIFAKSSSTAIKADSRPIVKKAVTRDLKKTAETIVEDPLSMLQDD